MILRSWILSAALLASPALAQSASKAPAAADYKTEAVIVERLDSVYRYNADGTGSKLDTDVALIQSEAGVQNFSILRIPYAADTQHIQVRYLRVRKADGSVVETPATDAQDQPAPVTQEAPFYSDLHMLQLPVRGLSVGDRLEYEILTTFSHPEAANQFWGEESLGSGVVVLSRNLELHVPSATYVNVYSPKDKPAIMKEGGETIYRWHGSQLKPSVTPSKGTDDDTTPAEPPADKLAPIAWTTFHSWAEVGEWYRKLSLDRAQPSAPVKARADSLVASAASPEAKIQALYGFVGPRIRYVGVAFGIGRYQPHEAAVVLANQYGDCKDKHTLLSAMLKAEGIDSSAVLIGEGIEINEAVPSPAAFNHLITLTGTSPTDQTLWLDATAEVAPFRMLEAPLRDKLALVIPPTGEPHLQRTPAALPFAAFEHFEAKGTLTKDGNLTGHMNVSFRGDEELLMRVILRRITPGDWDKVSQYFSNASGFGGTTSKTTADPPDDTTNPLHLAYDYSRTSYGDWDNHRIIPLLPFLTLPNATDMKAPSEPIDFATPQTFTVSSQIILPPDFTAELPESVHVKTAFATFDKTYKVDNAQPQTLTVERNLTLLTRKLEVKDWDAYKKFLSDIGVKSGEPWIQLTVGPRPVFERTAPKFDAPKTADKATSASAEDLVRQATADEKSLNWTAALADLDKAKALNDRQPYLWSNYGYVAMRQNKLDEAAEDYKREITNHPSEPNAYTLLAAMQKRQHQNDAALTTLRSGFDRNPSDTSLGSTLASELSSTGDYAGAEKTLRISLATHPDNLTIKLRLGDALLNQKQNDEANTLFTDIANTSNDASLLNDAGYNLALIGKDVPLAEKSVRRALDLIEQDTHNGEIGPPALRRTSLVLSNWDSLGWVLFLEGKYDEAAPWIRDAWQHSQHAEIGYHFGMLQEKQGHPADALATYQLALKGTPGIFSPTVQSELQDRIIALLAAKAGPPITNAPQQLQDQRTYKTLRLKNTEGFGTFDIVLSSTGVDAITLFEGVHGFDIYKDVLNALKLNLGVPKDSHALITRRGILSCHSGSNCEFVLEPTNTAANTQ